MITPNIDLHSHSTISDGLLTPAELVTYASQKQVQVLALTDHDDIAGLKEARLMSKKFDIIFINGVEISVTWRKRTIAKLISLFVRCTQGHTILQFDDD